MRALAEQLARLHAQKEALATQLASRIGALETELRGRDPQPALARLAERLAALENPAETPFAAIAEQLTRLYAQKDAGIEAVLTRLAPLEARLAEMEQGLAERDPRALLDRFAERLEAVQGRVAALEDPGESPFAGIAEQLTRLYAQKDASIETVLRPARAARGPARRDGAGRDATRARSSTASRRGSRRCRAGSRRSRAPRTPSRRSPGS